MENLRFDKIQGHWVSPMIEKKKPKILSNTSVIQKTGFSWLKSHIISETPEVQYTLKHQKPAKKVAQRMMQKNVFVLI